MICNPNQTYEIVIYKFEMERRFGKVFRDLDRQHPVLIGRKVVQSLMLNFQAQPLR